MLGVSETALTGVTLRLKDGGVTYVDGDVHAGLDTGALVRGGDLADLLAVNLGLGYHLGDLLRKVELLADLLRPAHGHNDAGVREAVCLGKFDSCGVDVGDDDLLALGLANSGSQQTNGAGTQNKDGGREIGRAHV